MLVAYDGAAFHGFAANPGVATVAGTLAKSMQRILGYEPTLTCAGRTDAGVHGWGQVVSFDGDLGDSDRLIRSLNALCGPSLVVRSIDVAADDFDARFSAVARTYRYRVLNRDVPDPFVASTTWHVVDQLDLEAMNRAGRDLVGEHDFGSFCRKRMVHVGGEEIAASLTREVSGVEWSRIQARFVGDSDTDIIELWISARAFCHQMVRAITGTLVDVGRGRIAPDAIPAILSARDRNAAGPVAPPHGLTLWSVDY
jgi:tRNA pseudouridine38-40 synthase